jgi:hypothetical protein
VRVVAEHNVQLVSGVGEIVQQPLGIKHATGAGDRNEDSQSLFLMFGGEVYRRKQRERRNFEFFAR